MQEDQKILYNTELIGSICLPNIVYNNPCFIELNKTITNVVSEIKLLLNYSIKTF